ncbi:MAG: hypothetical protein KDK70_08510, partial [Myxococcales bacterium]|nr:hypothetical protein [Myxococcales bacterium]
MGASLRQPLAAALLTLVAVVLGLGVPTAAHAGPEINIPRADDGPGIKAGQRSTFHTGAALVVGVDSNVFSTARSEPRGADVGPAPAAFIMPTGWLGIGNRKFRDGLLMSPPERSGRLADYYFGGIVGARQYLARNRNILRQRMPSFGLQARLALLPGRRFSVNFDGDVFRYAQPATYEAQPEYNFNRVDGRGRLLFIGRPGGGRFSIAMGPRFAGLRFDNATGDEDIAKGNRIVPGLGTELKWRFLPKSAVVLDYGMDFTYYTQCCVDVGSGRNEDNFAHRITAGYRGQVLKKLTLDAIAGYGLGFYRQDPNGPNFSSFIGDLAVSYFPNPRSVFHVGVYRSFQDSLLGNYYVDVGARVQARYEFKW